MIIRFWILSCGGQKGEEKIRLFSIIEEMIYKYIGKKFADLNLSQQSKQQCTSIIEKLSSKRQEKSKTIGIIKCCEKLISYCLNIKSALQIEDGSIIVGFVNALLLEIHEIDRMEINLIKIKVYILTIRWQESKKTIPVKVISRSELFLEQLRGSPLFDSIAADYYSHIEQLYLAIIQQQLRRGRQSECSKWVNLCLESFKAQFVAIANVLDQENKKMLLLMEKKMVLLEKLLRLEHGMRYLIDPGNPQQISLQIQHKYQKIAGKLPIFEFPLEKIIEQCESLWSDTFMKSNRKSSAAHRRSKKLSSYALSNIDIKNEERKRDRDSLMETVEYLNQYFRTRSKSSIEAQQRDIKAKTLKQGILKSKSLFFKDKKLDSSQCLSTQSVKKSVILKQIRQIPTKSKATLIEPRQFNLVLNMQRQSREKMIRLDGFANMKEGELIEGQKKKSTKKNQVDGILYPLFNA